MTHTEVVQILSDQLGLSQRKARTLLDATIDTLIQTLENQTGVTIPDLGTFGTHVRRQHKAYSPFNQSLVILPTKRTIFFHPSSILKEDIRDTELT